MEPTPETPAAETAQVDTNPFTIPIEDVEALGLKFGKHQIVVAAYDAEFGTIQVIGWGQNKEHKASAEAAGLQLQNYVEGLMARLQGDTAKPDERLTQHQDNYDEEGMADLNGVALQLGDTILLRVDKRERRAVLITGYTDELPIGYTLVDLLRNDCIVANLIGSGRTDQLRLTNFQQAVRTYTIRKLPTED